MGVSFVEGLMMPGELTADLRWITDELYAQIVPRSTHLLLYRGADLLAANVILRRPRRRSGVRITGRALDWRLGNDTDGPVIEFAEFISGRNKLPNPDFAFDDLYWVRPADTGWELAPGSATFASVGDIDDALAVDQPWPARPGDLYVLEGDWVAGGAGPGRLRARIICSGRYKHPNLMADATLEAGGAAWSGGTYLSVVVDAPNAYSGSRVMRVVTIPRPEQILNHDFEDGTNWSGGATFAIVTDADNARTGTGVLRCDANPYPQYIIDQGLETGTGWSGFGPNIGDVELVNDPANAHAGNWVISAGPVTQHQLFANSDFESSFYPAPAAAPGPRTVRGVGGADGAKPGWPALNPGVILPAASQEIPVAPPEHPGPPSLEATLASYGVEAAPEDPDPVTGYLRRYGYLPADVDPEGEDLEAALEDFQLFMDLEPTGEADEATLEAMAAPRCGVPDRVGTGMASWTYIGSRWEGVTTLKWYLHSPGPFTQAEMAGVMVNAFSMWDATNIPITFVETAVQAEAHIVIFWNTSPGANLAYAWQPPVPGEALVGTNAGDITFDSNDSWSLVDPTANPPYSILAAALHEIGHAIGLNHSAVGTAVMFPTLVGNIVLDADDVTGIETVYAGAPPPAPPPAPGSVIPYWFQSTELATPDNDTFYLDPGGGQDGSQAMTTEGFPAGVGVAEHKYARADADANPSGVDAFPVAPGEAYTCQGFVRAAPATDGIAYVAAHIPHPSVPNRERYWISNNLDGAALSTNSPDIWQRLHVDVTIPANRFEMNFLLEVHGHHAGYWAWDNVTAVRTRGNRAQLNSDTNYRVIPGTKYLFSCMVRSSDDLQVGSIRVGVILSGPGVEDEVKDVDKGFTDYVWSFADVSFTPESPYIYARPFVAAMDIVGEPVYLDHFGLTKTDNNTDQFNGTVIPVVPTQKYELSSDVRSSPDVYRGKVRVGVKLTGPGKAPLDFGVEQGPTTPEINSPDEWASYLASQPNGTPYETFETNSLADPNRGAVGYVQDFDGTWTNGATTPVPVEPNSKFGWVHIRTDVTPPPGYLFATPYVKTTDVEGNDPGDVGDPGCFWVDNVSLVKSDNNTDAITGTAIAVTPERTYKVACKARSGAQLRGGTVKLSMRCSGPGRATVIKESAPMGATEDEWKDISFDLTPPSGCDTVVPDVIATDVDGEFYLDDFSFIDGDEATSVFDEVSASTGSGSFALAVTVPDGTDEVTAAYVGESLSSGFTLTNLDLHRGETPVTVGEVFAALLLDPLTGLPLMEPGTVYGDDVIAFDWTVRNLTLGSAIARLIRGGVAGTSREVRVNPDNTMDLGTAAELFVDHVPGTDEQFIVASTDVIVLGEATLEEADEDLLSRLKVIGAERTGASGVPYAITGEAVNAADGAVDYYGRPYTRSRLVADSGADHPDYAAALARVLLDQANARGRTAGVSLSDPVLEGTVRPGEWIYVADAEAGLDDEANPVAREGRYVFPERIRAVEAQWQIGGPPYRLALRLPDGTEQGIDEELVLWSDATTVTLALGEALVEPDYDDQGGPAGVQFLRRQASDPGRR